MLAKLFLGSRRKSARCLLRIEAAILHTWWLAQHNKPAGQASNMISIERGGGLVLAQLGSNRIPSYSRQTSGPAATFSWSCMCRGPVSQYDAGNHLRTDTYRSSHQHKTCMPCQKQHSHPKEQAAEISPNCLQKACPWHLLQEVLRIGTAGGLRLFHDPHAPKGILCRHENEYG